MISAVVDRAFIGDDPLPLQTSGFADPGERARTRLPAVADGAFRLLAAIADAHFALSRRRRRRASGRRSADRDRAAERDLLVHPGFFSGRRGRNCIICHATWRRSNGVSCAVERPERDVRHAAQKSRRWRSRYRERAEREDPPDAPRRARLGDSSCSWFSKAEVALFAQELRTPFRCRSSGSNVDRACRNEARHTPIFDAAPHAHTRFRPALRPALAGDFLAHAGSGLFAGHDPRRAILPTA